MKKRLFDGGFRLPKKHHHIYASTTNACDASLGYHRSWEYRIRNWKDELRMIILGQQEVRGRRPPWMHRCKCCMGFGGSFTNSKHCTYILSIYQKSYCRPHINNYVNKITKLLNKYIYSYCTSLFFCGHIRSLFHILIDSPFKCLYKPINLSHALMFLYL